MKQFLTCLLMPVFALSQQKPISIGDKLPPGIFESLIAGEKLKPKNQQPPQLVILDFFATWCTGCVRELPKLGLLQQQFRNDLQIMVVTAESPEKLQAFRKKNKVFANCQLPILSRDTILQNLFPHKYIPHEVWINKEGKVVAITDGQQVNEKNVRSFLAGNYPIFTMKIDALDFDSKKPLLQNNNGGLEKDLLVRSLFTGYLKGINTKKGTIKDSSHTRYYFINTPILSLYRAALGFESNHVILNVSDTARYLLPQDLSEEWKQKNNYSYELTLPGKPSSQTMQQFLLTDLDRYLGLYGRIENRKVKCFAITRLGGDSSIILSKKGKPQSKFIDSTGIYIYTNQPFRRVINALNTLRFPSPGKPIFLDETNISFNVDIELSLAARSDIDILRKELFVYGLGLIEVEREIEMFILSETKKTNNKTL